MGRMDQARNLSVVEKRPQPFATARSNQGLRFKRIRRKRNLNVIVLGWGHRSDLLREFEFYDATFTSLRLHNGPRVPRIQVRLHNLYAHLKKLSKQKRDPLVQ